MWILWWILGYFLVMTLSGFIVHFWAEWTGETIDDDSMGPVVCVCIFWPIGLPIFFSALIVFGLPPLIIEWLRKPKPEYDPDLTGGTFREAPRCTSCGQIYVEEK